MYKKERRRRLVLSQFARFSYSGLWDVYLKPIATCCESIRKHLYDIYHNKISNFCLPIRGSIAMISVRMFELVNGRTITGVYFAFQKQAEIDVKRCEICRSKCPINNSYFWHQISLKYFLEKLKRFNRSVAWRTALLKPVTVNDALLRCYIEPISINIDGV